MYVLEEGVDSWASDIPLVPISVSLWEDIFFSVLLVLADRRWVMILGFPLLFLLLWPFTGSVYIQTPEKSSLLISSRSRR